MARNPRDMLAYEASRKPELAELIARLDTLSVDDIRTVHFLPWIRAALLAEKRLQAQATAGARAASLAEVLFPAHEERRIEPMGRIFRWTGPVAFVRLEAACTVEISPGKLLWLPDAGGILFEGLFYDKVEPEVRAHMEEVGPATRSAYMAAVNEQLAKLVAAPPALADTSGTRQGFTISRVPSSGSDW